MKNSHYFGHWDPINPFKTDLSSCKTGKSLGSCVWFSFLKKVIWEQWYTVSHYLFCLLWCHPEGPKMANRKSTLKAMQVTFVCLRFRSRSWKKVWGTVDHWKPSRTSQTCITVSGWVEKKYIYTCVITINKEDNGGFMYGQPSFIILVMTFD